MTADAGRVRLASITNCLPTAIALSMVCWAMPADAQSPVELSPPPRPASIQAPVNSRPLTVSPPRSSVQTLIPPRSNVTQLPSPPAVDVGQRQLVSVAPPAQSAQGQAAGNQPIDLSGMVPAINAVRTQLEILSPPTSPASFDIAGSASGGVTQIAAPSQSQSAVGQLQTLPGPPRTQQVINGQTVQQMSPPVANSAPQFSSRNSVSRPAANLVISSPKPNNIAPPTNPLARTQLPAQQLSYGQSSADQSPASRAARSNLVIETPAAANVSSNAPTARVATLTPPLNSVPRTPAAPLASILEIQAPVQSPIQSVATPQPPNVNRSQPQTLATPSNPTRIAQSPQSTTLPDNYRPLAPPALPGPQPGASFSQEVGSNQVTIIPPPGAPLAPTVPTPEQNLAGQVTDERSSGANNVGAQSQNNFAPNRMPPGPPSLPAMNPGASGFANPGGIEIVTVDPNNFVPGVIDSAIVANHEPVWQFNFQNAPWSVVIRNFAKQNGMALQMLTEPTGTLTFVDERPYPASEALDLLNDYLLAEGFLLIRNGNKLTAVTAGGPIQEGIVPFVPMRNIEILGRNELASVAIPIRATDAAMVMNEVQSLLSRVGRAQVVSNSSRLVITDTGAYLRRARDIIGGYGLAAGDMQTVVVHLKNTTADNMSSTISAHLGISLGGSTGVVTAGGAGGPNSVQTASFSTSTTMNASSTRVVPDRETNSLLISGTPAEVAEVQSLICQLDQARAQVILQGLILEVNLGKVNELGAEVGLQDSVLFNRSVIDNLVTLQNTNTAPNGVQTTNQNVVSQTSAPGFNFNGQPLGNNTAISPNVLGAQGLGNLGVGRTNSQLGFGGLVLSASSNSVSLLLRALQANFEVDVLSRPQIRTVDNKEAFIQIGQQVPVVDGVNVTAVGTANPIIRQDQAGIILKMTPNVSPDGMIQIKVSAEKSAFKLQPGTGVPIFTDARNGTVIQAPIKDITTAQATVSARAGQTIVLGGMITRDEETIERRVPGLSRIPLIGRLFRYDYNNVARKELLIFLTPHLIADDASSDAYKDSEIARTHGPLEHAEQMHGPLYTNPPVQEIEQ